MSVVRNLLLILFFASSARTQSSVNNTITNRAELVTTMLLQSTSVQQPIPIISPTLTPSSPMHTTNTSSISMSRTPLITPSRMIQDQNTSSLSVSISRTASINSSSIISSSSISLNSTTSILHSVSASSVSLIKSSQSKPSATPLLTETPLTVTTVLLSSQSIHQSSSFVITLTSANFKAQSSSKTIQETNTPVTTVPTSTNNSLQYVGVGIGLSILISAVLFGSIVLYLCHRTKKREYVTGNSEFRASVTVQRYNINKDHYTVNSDSAFSSRASSIRSSFGANPHKSRKTNFSSADHVTAVINLEMYSTPL